ncbi:MAG TPA: 1-(5-phosphoribosyl)-5-[(5-phosphoribosylamino)methylideneamino] imidazole-4-carboxamide isomerase [Rudaea sp.]|nr:1-(5-phosphoribosyl)-5-[(5-phosphoribosylamino)methylideneamino] imidazole-4-carboxamide isomerase [Rudaea sp.]
MTVQIMPAIDLREGHVVRLRQGDYARESRYAVDAIALADSHAQAGARWLHMVDLDGARTGEFANLRTIEAIARAGRLAVQAGGGVRDEAGLRRLFDAGVARAVVGSIALREPEVVERWITRFGAERIAIALDARCVGGVWKLPSAGWTQDEAATLDDLAPRFAGAGARHLLCTDIARDGMLSGPNLELYAHLRRIAPALSLIASGGIRDIADLQAMRGSGVAAAVLGRSLLDGALDLAEALAC